MALTPETIAHLVPKNVGIVILIGNTYPARKWIGNQMIWNGDRKFWYRPVAEGFSMEAIRNDLLRGVPSLGKDFELRFEAY